MRLVTFVANGGLPRLGVVLADDRVLDLAATTDRHPDFDSMLALIAAGPPALDRARATIHGVTASRDATARIATYDLGAVTLLAPIPRPIKNVFCVGLNYQSHIEQNARALGIRPEVGEVPLFFTKPTSAVVGTDAAIHLDVGLTQKLDYEVELAVVIGVGGSWIDEADALDHVFGYTLLNDVSARDLQWRTSQMFIGKGLDTYCPIGPWIVDAADAGDWSRFELTCRVNGEERQRDLAGNMIFSVPRIIAELSKGLTLEAGDIITTGTPGGCGYQLVPPQFLADGDVVECSAPGLGRLVNPIAAVRQAASRSSKGETR